MSGIPNFAPLATMEFWNFCNNQSPSEEEVVEGKKLEAILARADIAAVPAGIRGMSTSRFVVMLSVLIVCPEYALNQLKGYGAAPRRPLLPLKDNEGEAFMSALRELLELEAELERIG